MTTRPWTIPAAAAALCMAASMMAPAADAPSLDGTAWVLADLPGRALVKGTTATAQFAGNRLSGSDGCNSYSGTYTVKDSMLQVTSPLAATLRACPPDVTTQATSFMAVLTGAHSYRIRGGKLQLLSASGEVQATMAPQPQSLTGTSWQASGINNGKQAVVSLLQGTSVTMSFGADGRVSGSAGCNTYSAQYKSEGANLSFGQAGVTRKMCASPEGIMEQEQQFLRALATVATMRRDGDRLELRTADGAIALTLRGGG